MKRYIRSNSDYSEFVYNGKLYHVVGGYDSYNTNDPVAAITKWFELERSNPMDAAITAVNKGAAIDLLRAANPDLIEDLHVKYRCPYKLEYMLESIDRNFRNGYPHFLESEYGDQVDPFSYG